jgi:DNA invertase Pin-like site-specific DNA recombinase
MKYGYVQVSTDGQGVDAQVRQLTKTGCKRVFREVASGAKTDRAAAPPVARPTRSWGRADGDAA